MTNTQRTLVLASTSPFRKALLEKLQTPFLTYKPDVDESSIDGESPEKLVVRLAEKKAYAAKTAYPDALVIGSDQLAVCNGAILGKPVEHARAVKQLQQLSGQRVTFLTGLCLLDTATDSYQSTMVPFQVVFRHLTDTQIERYLKADTPYNCAGSFKSEGLGISLFERMDGDDPNALIGLPLIQLTSWLNQAGIVVP